jgi:hypothetical protein
MAVDIFFFQPPHNDMRRNIVIKRTHNLKFHDVKILNRFRDEKNGHRLQSEIVYWPLTPGEDRYETRSTDSASAALPASSALRCLPAQWVL